MGITMQIRLFILLFLCALAAAQTPNIIYVNTGSDVLNSGSCSLRAAILNVNAGAQPQPGCAPGAYYYNLIVLTVPTVTLTIGGVSEDNGLTGDLDIYRSLNISSSLNSGTVIDAQCLDRHFEIHSTSHMVLTDVTLTNGCDRLSNSQDKQLGGAIKSIYGSGSITAIDTVFSNNRVFLDSTTTGVKAGGAVISTVVFWGNNVTFSGNSILGAVPANSQVAGGLATFHLDSPPYLPDTIINLGYFISNIAGGGLQPTSLSAGGIGLFGVNSDFSGSYVFTANSGATGGAIVVGPGTEGCNITAADDWTGNTGLLGGVIYYAASPSHPYYYDTKFIDMQGFALQGNTADSGGVAYISNSRLEIRNAHIIANSASSNGGAFYLLNSYLSVIADDYMNPTTITGNVANRGGVVYTSNGSIYINGAEIYSNAVSDNYGAFAYVNGQYDTATPAIHLDYCGDIWNHVISGMNAEGGFAFVQNGDVKISNHQGSIYQNSAYKGGFIYSLNGGGGPWAIEIDGVNGAIYDNIGYSQYACGGLIFSEVGNVKISNVNEIHDNQAYNGDGGLVWANGGNVLIDSCGDIYNNFAFNGALVWLNSKSSHTATLSNNNGDIYGNIGFFLGGILGCNSTSVCTINNINGNFYNNECSNGCLVYAKDTAATISNIYGDIANNEAYISGPIADAAGVTIQYVTGSVDGNRANEASGGVINLQNAGASTVVQINNVYSISSNLADTVGGAVSNTLGTVLIDRVCHLDNNAALSGVGDTIYANFQVTLTFIGTAVGLDINTPSTQSVSYSPALSASITVVGAQVGSYSASVSVTGGSGGYTYQWSNGETGSTASSITSANFDVVVTDDSYCFIDATKSFPVPTANAGPDKQACPGVPITIGGSPSGSVSVDGVSGFVTYSWSPANFIQGSTTVSNPSVIVTSPTTFTVTVTDTATGLSSQDSMTVTVPTVLADAGADLVVCAGVQTRIGGNPTAITTGVASPIYSWTPTSGLSDNQAPNPVLANPQTSQRYSVTVTLSNCPAMTSTDSMLLTVVQPSTPFAEAYPGGLSSVTICQGSSITLGGDSVGSPGPLTYQWTPTTGLDDPTSAHPVATPSATTTYTLTVFILGRCASDSDSVTVVVSGLTADAGRDIVGGGTLGGSPAASRGQSPYSYQWSPSASLSNSQIANPTANPSSGLRYTLTVTDANGCVASDTVNVVIRNSLNVGKVLADVSFGSVVDSATAATIFPVDIASNLQVPATDIVVDFITQDFDMARSGTNYNIEALIYGFNGLSGETLVANYIALYGCNANVLPCTAPSNNPALLNSPFTSITFRPQFPDIPSISIPPISFYSSVISLPSYVFPPSEPTISEPPITVPDYSTADSPGSASVLSLNIGVFLCFLLALLL